MKYRLAPLPVTALLIAGTLWWGLAGSAHAATPGQVRSGNDTIDYNALSSNALPLVSTRAYGLRHASNQGLVTIAVNTGHGDTGHNVPFTVSGRATTLLGHPVPLKIHYVHGDRGNDSALITFHLSGSETVRFDLVVTPWNGSPTPLRFVHSYEP